MGLALRGRRYRVERKKVEEQDKQPTRKQSPAIKVRVLPEEKSAIEAGAKNAGLSVSAYLRQLGLDHEPRSMVDLDAVGELVRVSGHLGRVGGLLKLWLTDDKKLAEMAGGYRQAQRHIRQVLVEVEKAQEEIRTISRTVLQARR